VIVRSAIPRSMRLTRRESEQVAAHLSSRDRSRGVPIQAAARTLVSCCGHTAEKERSRRPRTIGRAGSASPSRCASTRCRATRERRRQRRDTRATRQQ
jgi:hypothetical protein